jgi:hypothetical protein
MICQVLLVIVLEKIHELSSAFSYWKNGCMKSTNVSFAEHNSFSGAFCEHNFITEDDRMRRNQTCSFTVQNHRESWKRMTFQQVAIVRKVTTTKGEQA